jgi:hypothetical protein
MSLARISTHCAAALLLLAAPLTAQDAAPAASPAPARDSLVTKPISAADREKFAGDYDILLPNGWIMATLIYVEDDQLMVEPEGEQKMPPSLSRERHLRPRLRNKTLRLAFEVKGGKVVGGKLTQHGQRMNVFRRQ